MGPAVAQKGLESTRNGPPVLHLESIVVRECVVPTQYEGTRKVCIWLRESFLPEKVSTCLTNICNRQRLLRPERFLQCYIPLVRPRQFQIWRKSTDYSLVWRLRRNRRNICSCIADRQSHSGTAERGIIRKRGC